VSPQHAAAERVCFALPGDRESGAFQPQVDPANAGEQRTDIHASASIVRARRCRSAAPLASHRPQ
jgi:hypothetical protein